jgi:hypothetical protein
VLVRKREKWTQRRGVGRADAFSHAARSGCGAEHWLDIVWWRSSADFAASRSKGANLPGIAAFFDAIGELVSSEEGELAGSGQPRQPPGNGGA